MKILKSKLLCLLIAGYFCVFSQNLFALTPKVEEASIDSSPFENWAIHGQFTNVTQHHPSFISPYSGQNSLIFNGRTEETSDLTLYAGLHIWPDAELWINPEVDQGFGLSNAVGLAGFSSGEAYKIGENTPYLRIPRAFLRQVIPLGKSQERITSAANQLADYKSIDNVTLTIGKFAVTDIFDTNTYAHDPRLEFLNWSVIDAGAFDYAADAWGFTYGTAVELTQTSWTLRSGIFQLSKVPNGKITGIDFSQFMFVNEIEKRYRCNGHPGKLKILVFANHGYMADYRDALRLAQFKNDIPDVSLVRLSNWRPGVSINLEQELTSDLGAFARASVNDGSKEAYEFTDINRSLSLGLVLKGNRWGREKDTFGIAAVVNSLSNDARKYFEDGGIGILIGDGNMHYGDEKIVEAYYSATLNEHLTLSLNYQHVNDPAYNHDRGPVSIFGIRLHVEF